MPSRRKRRASSRRRVATSDTLSRRVYEYVGWLRATRTPSKAVVYARCSGATPDQKAALERQLAYLIAKLQSLGVDVLQAFDDIGRAGSDLSRPGLRDAIAYAGTHDVPIISRDLSRLLRHYDDEPGDKYRFPTYKQLDALAEIASGVRLLTIENPRTSFRETERRAADTGRSLTQKSIGRPKKKAKTQPGEKKEVRELLRNKAKWFIVVGLQPVDLFNASKVARSTVYDTWNVVKRRLSDFSDRQTN